jgi:hypothetical protein
MARDFIWLKPRRGRPYDGRFDVLRRAAVKLVTARTDQIMAATGCKLEEACAQAIKELRVRIVLPRKDDDRAGDPLALLKTDAKLLGDEKAVARVIEANKPRFREDDFEDDQVDYDQVEYFLQARRELQRKKKPRTKQRSAT